MKAHEFLERGIGHMVDRAKTYDSPEGERSMGATVEAFAAVTGIRMTEEQGWLFMTLLKIVRSQQGAFKSDNYEDGAAYFGLMGEAAYNSNAKKQEFMSVVLGHDGYAAQPAPVSDQDPMAAIEWLPGMRWMNCCSAGTVAQSDGERPDVCSFHSIEVWGYDEASKLEDCGFIDEDWAAENWRTSLRENPEFRNDPKTWEAGDILKSCSTGEIFEVLKNDIVSEILALTSGDLVSHKSNLCLIRRLWEPDQNA